MEGHEKSITATGTGNNAIFSKNCHGAIIGASIMDDDPLEDVILLIIVVGIHDNPRDIIPKSLLPYGGGNIPFQHLETQFLKGTVPPGNSDRTGSQGQNHRTKSTENHRR